MEVTDKLIKEMPNVQENAIDQLDSEKEQVKAGFRDKMGRAFDALIHLTDDDGEPKLTKSGKLRIKRGFGPDAKTPKVSTIGGIDETGKVGFAQSADQSEAEILATGQSAASLTFVIGMAVFGSDGKPSQDEINQVTYAYQTYFRAKNIRDLPPGVVLVTALATYTVPRLMKPKTTKKISTLWDRARAKLSKNRSQSPDKDVETENHQKV